jgi:hypothetical protein|nr:MAG TPA: Head-to-tail joining protein W (GpW), fast protein folding, downhill [Caudoviricetes sp.]
METEQRLQEINNAITTILSGGQSYRIGNMSMTRADLSILYNMKKNLEEQLAAEGANVFGKTSAAVFDRR